MSQIIIAAVVAAVVVGLVGIILGPERDLILSGQIKFLGNRKILHAFGAVTSGKRK